MAVQEWTHEDKSGWGEGVWQDEPDKIQWVDPTTDLDCLMVRNNGGAWCGYVGVPESHPFFGQGYSEKALLGLDCHGGLTFADLCAEDSKEGHGICHIPEPGRPDKIWWLGFDCAHAFDCSPKYMNKYPEISSASETYRDREYVVAEVTSLAKQVRDNA